MHKNKNKRKVSYSFPELLQVASTSQEYWFSPVEQLHSGTKQYLWISNTFWNLKRESEKHISTHTIPQEFSTKLEEKSVLFLDHSQIRAWV